MPRLVRQRSLLDRIKTTLDPGDLFLWLAEELNDDAYDEWLKLWAVPIGVGLNFVFILARGASKRATGRTGDDVFGDDGSGGSGWFAWVATFLVHFLTLLCCLNALITFFRKRSYRLFEQPVDIAPATPSAHRVRVDSSPMSSSPLRYFQTVVSSATAASRAYPDAEREVWELNVWDPKPFNLELFTLFSPGHLVIYYLLLPPTILDPRPSVTVFTAIAFAVLLTGQLWFMKASFAQQAKDKALVHGEVMNEYDTKFVHPNLMRPMRDVGIQSHVGSTTPRMSKTREVDVYTPTTLIKRGFKTNPNTNYARQYDPDNLASQKPEPRRDGDIIKTPPPNGYATTSTQSISRPADFSTPSKRHHELLRERSPAKGDGGNLGVYTHAASPLRKAASTNHIRPARDELRKTLASPLKRTSTPGGGLGSGDLLDSARRRQTGRY